MIQLRFLGWWGDVVFHGIKKALHINDCLGLWIGCFAFEITRDSALCNSLNQRVFL